MSKITEKEIIDIILDYENPHPRETFSWDNQKECDFNQGHFHSYVHSLIENFRFGILTKIREFDL